MDERESPVGWNVLMQPDLGGIQDRYSGPADGLADVAPVLDLDVRRLLRIDGREMGWSPEAMQAGQCLDEHVRRRLVDGTFVDTMSTEIIDYEKRSAENVSRRFGPSSAARQGIRLLCSHCINSSSSLGDMLAVSPAAHSR